MNRSLLCLGLAATALGLCTGARATLVSFQIPGARLIMPVAINDDGQVTGIYEDPSYNMHGFLWQPDRPVITFDAGAAAKQRFTWPVGITASGVITGWYTAGAQSGSFVRAADGTITTITLRHALAGQVSGANEEGWNVGVLQRRPDGPFRSFLRSPAGKIKEFTVPGAGGDVFPAVVNKSRTIAGEASISLGAYSRSLGFVRTTDGAVALFGDHGMRIDVRGINDAGTIVGSSGNVPAGFVRTSDGAFTKFAPPGAIWTDANAINNSGTIAGSAIGNRGPWYGFLRASDGTFTTVTPEGSVGTALYVINNKGMVAGSYTKAKDVKFGFAGTP